MLVTNILILEKIYIVKKSYNFRYESESLLNPMLWVRRNISLFEDFSPKTIPVPAHAPVKQ